MSKHHSAQLFKWGRIRECRLKFRDMLLEVEAIIEVGSMIMEQMFMEYMFMEQMFMEHKFMEHIIQPLEHMKPRVQIKVMEHSQLQQVAMVRIEDYSQHKQVGEFNSMKQVVGACWTLFLNYFELIFILFYLNYI